MAREVRWHRMFPDELEAAMARRPVVYLPLGLCELHGYGNAVGLDALNAEGIAVRAAQRDGGIVAPTVYWHEQEIGEFAVWSHKTIGPARTWMTALPPWVFLKNLLYQFRAFDALGFKVAVALTGHAGPGLPDIRRLAEIAQPHLSTRLIAQLTLDDVMPQAKELGWEMAHAGALEASCLLAVAPDCVDASRFPKPGELPPRGTHQPLATGGDINLSRRRDGQWLVDQVVARLTEHVQAAINDHDRLHADAPRRPLSFAATEAIWRQQVMPALPSFTSMKQPSADRMPPEDSPWRLNSAVPPLQEIVP